MILCSLFIVMHTICILYFLFGKLTGSVLHIGAFFVTIQNTNQIYYYHIVDVFATF